MASNDRAGVAVKQPRADEERFDAAKKCSAALEISMPVLVDHIDDRVGHAYSGMPDRLYVIDRAGRVVYKGGRGPFGFKPGEMEQSLVMLLLDQQEGATRAPATRENANGWVAPALVAGRKPARVPLLSNEEAWKRLPPLEQGKEQPLPHWARALAAALPRTTAMMLELDDLHRTKSPLGAELRALLRCTCAIANRCEYSRTYALAEYSAATPPPMKVDGLVGYRPRPRSEGEIRAVAFAGMMSTDAEQVTDDQVAQLVKDFGEERVVAMVALIAYANFQDRLLLSLGLDIEPGGPLKPLNVKFKRQLVEGRAVAPQRKLPEPPSTSSVAEKIADPDWLAAKFDDLQSSLNNQRARPPRIRVPTWEEVKPKLPPGYPANRPSKINWSLVCMGYQPELSAAWLTTMRTFGQEAKQDRVFEETLFWVITRSLKCFY